MFRFWPWFLVLVLLTLSVGYFSFLSNNTVIERVDDIKPKKALEMPKSSDEQ